MIVDQDIYDHLEHHGVKGMHWGIRNELRRDPKTGIRPLAKKLNESKLGKASNQHARNSMGSPSAKAGRKIGKTAREHPKTTKAIGIAAGTVAVGGLAAAAILRHKGVVKVKNLQQAEKMYHFSRVVLMQHNDIKISQIRNAERFKKISPDQSARLVKLATRQTLSGLLRAHQAFKAAGG